MARIKMIDEEEAKGKVKELYNKILSKEPRVPGLLKVFSVRADLLESMIGMYDTLMGCFNMINRIVDALGLKPEEY